MQARLLLLGSWAVLLPTFFDKQNGDVIIYYEGVKGVLAGGRPYRDVLFEYPPYALVFTLLPGLLLPSYRSYRAVFSGLMLVVDYVAKRKLVQRGRTSALDSSALWGLVAFTFTTLCAQFLYLKRFDVLPVTLALIAAITLCDQRFVSAGALLGAAIGVKIYPVVLGPIWLAYAWKQGRARRFIVGGVVALAPLAVIAAWLPFWKMFDFHLSRGMEAESLLASFAWLLGQAGITEATWFMPSRWYEVGGPLVEAWAPWARQAWYLASLGSAALGAALVARRRATADDVMLASWLALLGFITFNIVLSPQYMLWLGGALAGWIAVSPNVVRQHLVWFSFFAIAVVLTSIVFPSPLFAVGIDVGRSFALVTRNLLLVGLWILAAQRALQRLRA